MRVDLEFTVTCSQCFEEATFREVLLRPSTSLFDEKVNDAIAYFLEMGFRTLPSGKWICNKSAIDHARKEAA